MSCVYNVIKSLGMTVTTEPDALQIEIPSNTFVENERFCLILMQEIPTTESIPVELISGTTVINMYNRIGNVLRADQLKNKRRLLCVYGTDVDHVLVFNHMKDSVVAKEAK